MHSNPDDRWGRGRQRPAMPPNSTGRHSIRLSGYRYTRRGWYFITICTADRVRMLAHLRRNSLELTSAGRIVADAWADLPARFPHIVIDAFVVMLDHIHGIIVIRGRPQSTIRRTLRTHRGSVPGSLPAIVQGFKSMSTRRIRSDVDRKVRVWQRNYYERIIRDDEAIAAIRRYIGGNPAKWIARYG